MKPLSRTCERRGITVKLWLSTLAIAVILLTTSVAGQSQQAVRVSRIGLLSSASSSAGADRLLALKQGLHALGYVEGQNLTIEYRWAEGRDDRLPALAADLVRLKVEMIVTQGTLATLGGPQASDLQGLSRGGSLQSR